jgi:hypothetical protein
MATKVPNAYSFSQALLYRLIPNFEEEIDPNNPMHQIAVQTVIHEMAGLVSDRATRDGIQGFAKKGIANMASKTAK